MANAPPITSSPLIATQGLSARWRSRILLALIGLYYFVTLAAPILIDDAGLLLLKPHGWWREVDRYWLHGCTILIAGWVALGPGRMAIRAPLGLIAIGWLLLAWLLGLTMSPNWKPELEWTGLGCAVVATETFVVLLVVRRYSGKRIVRADGTIGVETTRFQYSLTTLLLFTFLVCMTLALFGWIDPRYRNYATDPHVQARWYFAVTWQSLLKEACKEAVGSLLIAAACLPVFLSNRKRRFAWALGLSAVSIIVIVLSDEIVRTDIVSPFFQGKPIERYYFDYYLVHHVANLATVILCLSIAATAMHWLGYRLQALPRAAAPPTPSSPRSCSTAATSPRTSTGRKI